MSDTETTETTEDQVTETGKGLRAQLEASLSRERELKARILNEAYAELGLNPEVGLGKAIAKEYEGEASKEALAAYATQEYGYTPPIAEDSPIAGTVQHEQARLDAVQQTAGSIPAPTRQEELAAAEAQGDYRKALDIKGQEVASWFGQRR
jgi:murein DD-endopeptidase MepM/ murein hydrolase activator NlpD